MKKHQIVPNQDIWLETGMDPQFLFGLIGIPVCLSGYDLLNSSKKQNPQQL